MTNYLIRHISNQVEACKLQLKDTKETIDPSLSIKQCGSFPQAVIFVPKIQILPGFKYTTCIWYAMELDAAIYACYGTVYHTHLPFFFLMFVVAKFIICMLL